MNTRIGMTVLILLCGCMQPASAQDTAAQDRNTDLVAEKARPQPETTERKTLATEQTAVKTAATAPENHANPLAYDYSSLPEEQTEDAAPALDNALRRRPEGPWDLSTEGFVRQRYANLWTRLRQDHNLHGFVQLGIGTDDMWETRVGVGVDLVPDKVKLGLEAAAGRWTGTFRDWD